jgi:hypothetical protein
MGPAPLPEAPADHNALLAQMAALRIAPPAGAATSPVAAQVSGRRYLFDANGGNRVIKFTFGDSDATYTVKDHLGTHLLQIGMGGDGRPASWREGSTGMVFTPARTVLDTDAKQVACAGAWEDERTFAFTLCYPETPFHPTARYRFDGDTVTMSLHPNAGWEAIAGVAFIGRVA